MRSATYFLGPRARSFMLISTMKTQVKIWFIRSRLSCKFYSMSYDSIAMPIVFTRTLRVINELKKFVRVKAFNTLLAFLRPLWNPFGQTLILFIWLRTHWLLAMFKAVSSTSYPDQTGVRFLNWASTFLTSKKSISRLVMSSGKVNAFLISVGIWSILYLGSTSDCLFYSSSMSSSI